jgi:hypothetical protein
MFTRNLEAGRDHDDRRLGTLIRSQGTPIAE